MQKPIMLKTTRTHSRAAVNLCLTFKNWNLDPWPLNLLRGVLLSSLFLSLLHYCPRLTAFTSSAGFIWPLCQLRQIGPAATTQYAMAEVAVKITINQYNRHIGCRDCFLLRLTCVKSWSCLQVGEDRSTPYCCFSLSWFSFCWMEWLMGFFCWLRSFKHVLWCPCPKLGSATRFSPHRCLHVFPLRTLIGSSWWQRSILKSIPREDYDLN